MAQNSSENGLHPPQIPLDVDNYPLAPPELSLKQVHIYVRHGERTPVKVRLSDPPASIPAHWLLCRTARHFRASMATFENAIQSIPHKLNGTDFLPVERIVERADGTAREGECLLGELTDVGRQSTFNYGHALRKLYIEKLGFLPDTLHDNNEAYFRSTNVPRTVESLQQIIHGLYPLSKHQPGVTPQLRIRNREHENLVGNTFSCKRLEQLLIGFAHSAATAYNRVLEPLDAKLSRYIGGNPVRIDGQPRASGILDTIRASTAHGMKVPPEFEDESVLGLIEKAVTAEWFADKTEEVRRLGMGRLLGELEKKMSAAAYDADAYTPRRNVNTSNRLDPLGSTPHILIHSTHDTAIAAILSTLDVYDEKWPAFTASVTFELFSKTPVSHKDSPSYMQTVLNALSPTKQAPTEHFVRAHYQNRTLTLPLCADRNNHLEGHPELCTLAAFVSRMRALAPKEGDWEQECAIHLSRAGQEQT